MKIEKHIAALLYRYQCVTLPGFGAFLTEVKTAQIDTDTHTFYPPKKLISFNANVKNNDGLLASHIALQENISYDEAVTLLAHTAEVWHAKLQANNTIFIKNLGTIRANSEGRPVFTPDTPVNYLTDSFGLASVLSPAVVREELQSEAEIAEEETSVITLPQRKRNYAYLKYAAVFIVALSIGSAGFKVYQDREAVSQTLLVEKAVQEKVYNKIQQATFFIETPLPAVHLSVKDNKEVKTPYHIVAGAFRNEANAEKAFKQLTKLGYNAKRLAINKFGLYPVLYGSFATYAEAQQNMNEIHKNHNKEAWLLIKEL